ncbi:MAG: MFS transporter [Gammaproteobacteria bacterium]
MSIIVAVRKGPIAVIGADTAESEDDLVIQAKYIVNHSKLLEAGDNILGLAGWSATQHILESLVRSQKVPLKLGSTTEIFETARALHEVMKTEYFMDPQEEKEQPVESSQISALIVNPSGIFELESYRSVAQYTKFWAIGSGKRLAIGAMHAAYDLLDDPEAIARAGMAAACEFDDGCCAPVEIKRVALKH